MCRAAGRNLIPVHCIWTALKVSVYILDDRGNESQRESLAPRLAVLKMQLEEKRRHIEEEKRKMMHQWNEERTKLGQQAFWLAVGKESNLERERREQENQAALVYFFHF